MLSFKNTNILINNKIKKSCLSINNKKFVKYVDSKDAITLSNKYIVVPGFIEQHMHGAKKADVMNNISKSLHTISKALLVDGVTS